jgi:hypothetical protein
VLPNIEAYCTDFIIRVKELRNITVLGLGGSEDEGTKMPRNVGKYFADGTE